MKSVAPTISVVQTDRDMARCSACIGRVEGVNGFWGTVATGVGTVAKNVAPVVLPPLLGMGVGWLSNKVASGRATTVAPGPLATPVAEQEARREQDRTSLYVGIGVAAIVVVVLLARKR